MCVEERLTYIKAMIVVLVDLNDFLSIFQKVQHALRTSENNFKLPYRINLKGKFSSGREGALHHNSITISNKNNYQKWCFAFIFESFLCLFE